MATNRQGQHTDKQIKHCSMQPERATRIFARLQHSSSCLFRNCCSNLIASAACRKDSKCLVASERENTELVWRLDPSIPNATEWLGLSEALFRLPVIFNSRASKGICGDKIIKDGAALTWRGFCVSCLKSG